MHKDTDAKNGAGSYPPMPEPLDIAWPELHSQALGCGVEDHGCRDRYEAAEYGWKDGVDRAADCVPEQIFDADQMRAFADATAALRARGAVPSEPAQCYNCRGTKAPSAADPEGKGMCDCTPPAAPMSAKAPSGWKLVPVEPTEAMVNAAYIGGFGGGPTGDYLAMLAAAPAAPGSGVEQDAARLDWLQEQACDSRTGISFDYEKYAEAGQVLEKGYRFMRRHYLGERQLTLRDAIDAAMKDAI